MATPETSDQGSETVNSELKTLPWQGQNLGLAASKLAPFLERLRQPGVVVCDGAALAVGLWPGIAGNRDVDKLAGSLIAIQATGMIACGLCCQRQIRSVANLTRQDAVEFLQLAPQAGVRTTTKIYPLEGANEALADLRAGRFQGAAVLVP